MSKFFNSFFITVIVILFSILLNNCKKNKPRKAINQKSAVSDTRSINRNIKIKELEGKIIDEYIKKDSSLEYQSSEDKIWYAYLIKDINKNPTNIGKGDTIIYEMEVKNFNDSIIYSFEENGILNYVVDKQLIINGLEIGFKKMKLKEKVKFLIPSIFAYGFRGDKNKIGINQPIICTINYKQLKKIKI